MKTILILVGKTTDKHFQAGIDDYAGRITHYMPFDIVTIPELRQTKSLSEEQQKAAEGTNPATDTVFRYGGATR
jgi:23S rRNA (pseudouridine1915-N3)-methyltransferase